MEKYKEPISEYNARMREIISSLGVNEETIFDYNPTDAELKRFGGRERFAWLMEQNINLFEHDDDRYYCLALLFGGRKDKSRFLHYCSLIKNKSRLGVFMQDF